MELEEEKSLKDYLHILRRRKYTIIIPMLALLLLSTIVSIILPPVYRSKATILIEQQHIPTDLVRSTVVSFADERIRQIEQKLMTIDNLNKIIEKFNLYTEERKVINPTILAEEFRKNTALELINADVIGNGKNSKATLAFTLSFDHKVPVISQKVANELVTLFLDENKRFRKGQAEESTKFLEEEAEKVKLEIQKIENQIAEYKQQYSGSLPELMPVNMASIARIENSLQQLEMQEKMLNERKISLHNQLTTISPVLTTAQANDPNAPKVENRASLEAQYEDLIKKYSSNHPDVKELKRRLDGLKSKKGGNPDITNPAYLQLQSELNIAAVELTSINQQRASLNEQLKKLEQNVAQTHQVERGYYELMRDLENHKAKYTELKAKFLEAKLSLNLESEQKGETFTLIEPPRVPEKPEKPNRLKLLFLGFVLSVGGGLGSGLLAEMLDNSIRSHTVLAQLTGSEPLVVIPYIQNQEDAARSKRNKINFAILCLFLFIGATLAVHFFYMPLDMVFNKLSDRLSMMF